MPQTKISFFLSGLVAEDVRVTGIQDGHGGATEELSEGGTQLNLQKGKKCEPENPPKSFHKTSSLGQSQEENFLGPGRGGVLTLLPL